MLGTNTPNEDKGEKSNAPTISRIIATEGLTSLFGATGTFTSFGLVKRYPGFGKWLPPFLGATVMHESTEVLKNIDDAIRKPDKRSANIIQAAGGFVLVLSAAYALFNSVNGEESQLPPVGFCVGLSLKALAHLMKAQKFNSANDPKQRNKEYVVSLAESLLLLIVVLAVIKNVDAGEFLLYGAGAITLWATIDKVAASYKQANISSSRYSILNQDNQSDDGQSSNQQTVEPLLESSTKASDSPHIGINYKSS